MTATRGSRSIGDIVTRRRIVISLLLAVAFAALLASANAHHDAKPAPPYPAPIASLYPRPATPSIERQTAVFAELKPGYDGRLEIDDRKIPDDQIQRLATGNMRLVFTPGEGREFTQFRPGLNHATVVYWRTGTDPNSGTAYTWYFNLA